MKKELRELFGLLNQNCQYLILRNWDNVFDEDIYGSGHADIDILCNSISDFVKITGAYRVHNSRYRDNFEVKWGDKKIRFDVRWVGDGYYPFPWEQGMLNRRVLSEHGVYIPEAEDYYYSLSYHALLQKPNLSKEYQERLGASFGNNNNAKVEINEECLLSKLDSYLREKCFKFEIPRDPGVYINWDNIKRLNIKKNRIRLLRHFFYSRRSLSLNKFVKNAYYYIQSISRRNRIDYQLLYKYLEKGSYRILSQGRLIIVRKDIPTSFLTMIAGRKESYYVGRFLIKDTGCDNELPKAHVAMMTANTFRFFDYRTGVTFTIFEDEVKRESLQKAVSVFSAHFSTPIISINNHYCVEKIIYSIPRRDWSDADVITQYYRIFKIYISYLQCEKSKGLVSVYQDKYTIPNYKEIPPEDIDEFKGVLKQSSILDTIPHVFCHCDLHFGNILREEVNGELYLIDFEYARENIFFYDLFNIMFVDFSDYHNSRLLDLYLEGDGTMIGYFGKAFEAMGVTYDSCCSTLYLKLFLLNRMIYYTKRAEKRLSGKRRSKKLITIFRNIHNLLEYIRQHER